MYTATGLCRWQLRKQSVNRFATFCAAQKVKCRPQFLQTEEQWSSQVNALSFVASTFWKIVILCWSPALIPHLSYFLIPRCGVWIFLELYILILVTYCVKTQSFVWDVKPIFQHVDKLRLPRLFHSPKKVLFGSYIEKNCPWSVSSPHAQFSCILTSRSVNNQTICSPRSQLYVCSSIWKKRQVRLSILLTSASTAHTFCSARGIGRIRVLTLRQYTDLLLDWFDYMPKACRA